MKTPKRAKTLMIGRPDIITAMNDPNLFGPWFRGPSWDGWRSIVKAIYCLPMSDLELAFFRSVAERDPPTKRCREAWICAGRRSGKDSVTSMIKAHSAAFFNGAAKLRRGERALCLSLACDRDQARIIVDYTRAYFTDIPPLAGLVDGEMTRDSWRLLNATEIACGTNNYRSVRGRPILTVSLDECAFYKSEDSATPDVETYRALMPGLATIDDAMLIAISSPHAKSGLLYQKYVEHYGRDSDDVLFVRAPTTALNPTIDHRIIEKALAEDFDAANAEWNAVFREGISGLIGSEVMRRCIVPGRTILQPDSSTAMFVS